MFLAFSGTLRRTPSVCPCLPWPDLVTKLSHLVLQPFLLEGCSEQVLNLFLEPHHLHVGPAACQSMPRIPSLAGTPSARSIPAPSTHCPSCRRVLDPSRSAAYPVLCCPSVPGQPPPWDTSLASPWEQVAVRDAGTCLPHVLCSPTRLATLQPRASPSLWIPLPGALFPFPPYLSPLSLSPFLCFILNSPNSYFFPPNFYLLSKQHYPNNKGKKKSPQRHHPVASTASVPPSASVSRCSLPGLSTHCQL